MSLLLRVNRLELLVRLVLPGVILMLLKDSKSIIKIGRNNVAVVFVLSLPTEWLGKLIVARVEQDVAGLAVHGDLKSKHEQSSLLVHIANNVAEVATGE